LSVVGAVIGEFTGSVEGIGHLINTSSYYLETPLMFAGIMLISLAGIAFFYLVSYVERVVVFWEMSF
jgi:NitT/TauT family transport system permease protein